MKERQNNVGTNTEKNKEIQLFKGSDNSKG